MLSMCHTMSELFIYFCVNKKNYIHVSSRNCFTNEGRAD